MVKIPPLNVQTLCFLSLDLEGYLYIFHALIAFCSGQVVPLWFYPDFLLRIINWLPFKYVFYEPLLLFIRNGNLFQTVCFQVIWIFILSLIGRFMWKCVSKKIVVQGG